MILEQAFLSDITENPTDDTPRLVYADWLDDQGEPERAELIRVQCRRARLAVDDPEQGVLAARETDLLARHESAWLAALPALHEVTWVAFRRGFVESVFLDSAEAFLRHAPVLFATAPIRCVQIGQIDPSGAKGLAGSVNLGQLSELNLGNGSGLCSECVRYLAGSEYIERLESLLLHNNDLGDEGITELARSKHLWALRELYISGTGMGDAGAAALGDRRRMPQLVDLDLRDNQIGDHGARRLASSMGLSRLATLWMVNNQIGAEGADALATSVRLPALKYLYLNYNPIGDAGGEALAASPHRVGLIELDLRHCGIGDAGARALAGSPYLEQVQIIWLGGNRLRMETLTLLRRRFGERLRI
jgi:uncharacterized protein (TIGR02996 family)